jgi:hypothetical protein
MQDLQGDFFAIHISAIICVKEKGCSLYRFDKN